MFGTKSSTPRQGKPPPADIEPHEDPNANKGGKGRRARPDEAAAKKGADDARPQEKGRGGETKASESRAQGNFFAATGTVPDSAAPPQADKRRTAADMDDADADDEENNKSENLKRRGRSARDDDGDEIMLIPDLEDEDRPDNEDELASKVAAAPRNVVRKLKSLRELDNDIKHVISSVGAGGLDLSLLTSCLVPHELVAEEDGEWQFDALLQELTQQLNADMELHRAKHGTPPNHAQPKPGDPSTTMTTTGGDGAKGLGTTTGGGGMHVRPSRLGALLTEAK